MHFQRPRFPSWVSGKGDSSLGLCHDDTALAGTKGWDWGKYCLLSDSLAFLLPLSTPPSVCGGLGSSARAIWTSANSAIRAGDLVLLIKQFFAHQFGSSDKYKCVVMPPRGSEQPRICKAKTQLYIKRGRINKQQ